MVKGWSSESTTNRLLMIIALFVAILTFALVFVLESASWTSTPSQENKASLSGYFAAVTPANSPAVRAASKPDLVAVLDQGVSLKLGQSVVFAVKTQNNGAAASWPSLTKITVFGSSPDLVFQVPALGQNAFALNEFVVKCAGAGDILVRAFGDFGKQTEESDENNNIDAVAVECK